MMRFSRFLLALALLAALTATFPACQKKAKRGTKSAEKKKADATIMGRFEAARALLTDQKYAEAAAAFEEIGRDPNISQPLLNWTSVLHGLALLLQDREKEARAVFAPLVERGAFSEKEDDALMVKFFVNIGKALSGDAVIPATVSREFDKWSFEGIVFLLYGLKNWNLGNFDEAIPLFQEFAGVRPERAVAWADGPAELQKLQNIATGSINDYQEYRPAKEALTAATTPEQQFEAVEMARAARAKMKLTTKLSRELDEKINEIGPKVAGIMAEREKASKEELAFDAQALPAAKKKRAELHDKFLFAEARLAILEPPLKTEKAREEQALLAKKSLWLANYKDQLLEDLNAKGYAQPLTSRKGAPIAGGIARADAQHIYINSPRGLVPVPWSEVSLESAFTIGKSFVSPDFPPIMMAFRKWHLGVFGFFAKQPESLTLLKEAAELRPVFAQELPLFENPSAEW